jgi:hypothetical protein
MALVKGDYIRARNNGEIGGGVGSTGDIVILFHVTTNRLFNLIALVSPSLVADLKNVHQSASNKKEK